MTGKAELSEGGAQPEIRQPGLKFLEAAVYIMGGLLVLMLVGLIVGIIWKVTHRAETPPPVTQLLDLGLPAGTRIEAMELAGDRLAVNTGIEIIVVDIRKNAVISRISIAAK
ncbi:MAG: hypothetical protein H7X89_03315 [Rhizobiales bacterium]|nr:hypothetical protein [Hyphomicrobiales bacterium]